MGIGERIKIVRGELSRPQFGKRIGVSQTAIQNYETLDQIPNGSVLLRISEEFGVSIDWLLRGEGEPYIKKGLEATNVIPMDMAVEIVMEVEQEEGIKLNARQKEAVIKILREEIERSRADSIAKYRELVSSFKKEND